VRSFFRPSLTSHWLLLVRSIHLSFCTFRCGFGRRRTSLGPFLRVRLRVTFSFFSFVPFFTWGLLCTWSTGHEFRRRVDVQECF
jgi:hypothetical protein